MFRILFATFLIVALLSCSDPQPRTGEDDRYVVDPERRPTIIVLVVDDLRWDELGVTGHPFLETPNIDRLANDGVMFSRAFHSVPVPRQNSIQVDPETKELCFNQ